MGIFKDGKGYFQQRDRLFELRSDLHESKEWESLFISPLFGSGVRTGFAEVDCRRCGKSDAALLVDQTIWGWQTHKMSYSNCISDPTSWAAENQGPQRAKTKSDWLKSQWAVYDETTGSVNNLKGYNHLSSESFESLEAWIISNFMDRAMDIKITIAGLIRSSDKLEHQKQLDEHIKRENLDI